MKFVIALLFSFCCLTTQANAWSWAAIDQLVSEYAKDKAIFWGRPLRSTWQGSTANETFGPDVVTEVKVLKELQGQLPSKVKITHSMSIAACGTNYLLGAPSLIVVERRDDGTYFADEVIVRSAPKYAVVAYLIGDIDVSTAAAFRSLNFELDVDTQCENENSKYCLPQNKFSEMMDVYTKERNKIDKLKELSWWKKFSSKR